MTHSRVCFAEHAGGMARIATSVHVIIAWTSPRRPKSICFNKIAGALAEQPHEMVLDT
jgi:hypothetical protein